MIQNSGGRAGPRHLFVILLLKKFFNFIAMGRNGLGVIAFNKLDSGGSNNPIGNHSLNHNIKSVPLVLTGNRLVCIFSAVMECEEPEKVPLGAGLNCRGI
jgi:hypothetical protein